MMLFSSSAPSSGGLPNHGYYSLIGGAVRAIRCRSASARRVQLFARIWSEVTSLTHSASAVRSCCRARLTTAAVDAVAVLVLALEVVWERVPVALGGGVGSVVSVVLPASNTAASDSL